MKMKGYLHIRAFAVLLAGVSALTVACGKEPKQDGNADSAKSAATSANAPAPTGKTIIVEAYSDEKGNYFKPAEIEAHPGDVVRFVLKSGVHNINFLADSNPGKTGLPAPSDMLQLPDQTYDLNVTFAKGHYYFQCDPHAALGMKGRLEVED
jgi:plastocyanin